MKILLGIAAATLLPISLALAQAPADKAQRPLGAELTGYQEVPPVSTTGRGVFTARINRDSTAIDFELSYVDLEGAVQQAHIHFAQPGVNGGVIVWLCSNLASPPTPTGVPACPAAPATLTGTIGASQVVGPSAQGIGPGQFAEFLAALRAGATYVNVHTSLYPGGEIRGQIGGPGRGK